MKKKVERKPSGQPDGNFYLGSRFYEYLVFALHEGPGGRAKVSLFWAAYVAAYQRGVRWAAPEGKASVLHDAEPINSFREQREGV